MKKKGFYYLVMALFLSLGCSLVSCGDSDDDESGGGGSVYDWSNISGKYLSKPTREDMSVASIKFTYLEAKGLEVKNNCVVCYPSVSNCKYMSPKIPETFTGFLGGESVWKGDLDDYYIFGVEISGDRLLVMDDNWNPTGNYLTITPDGVEYNGVKYYRQSYFNANVNGWVGY